MAQLVQLASVPRGLAALAGGGGGGSGTGAVRMRVGQRGAAVARAAIAAGVGGRLGVTACRRGRPCSRERDTGRAGAGGSTETQCNVC